ncbi:hypothetical protein KKH07_02065 [Patescibacteria group bacterium]|nr:hypothetical protein [Patescibacteria group bacterium]
MFLKGKKLQQYKDNLVLSKKQREFIIGSLLGDGSMRIPGHNVNANFIAAHSEKQKDYVLWKYSLLKEWVLTSPRKSIRKYHKDKTRNLVSWRFLTLSHPQFTDIYNTFYRNNKKIVPDNIKELLVSPFSLAVWVMDDGNRNQNALFLNTQGFLLQEQERLCKCLKENFGLGATINKHSVYNKRQLYRIRINTVSTRKLYYLVQKYLLSSMCYKIPFPRND